MADDDESFIPGPLDELIPGLRQKAERFPALPIHARVVHAQTGAGERSIVLASFAPAANLRALHAALKRVVEATMLATLSSPHEAPAAESASDEGRLAALELYVFAQHPFDIRPALAPFALFEAPLDDGDAHRACALLRREARHVDGSVPEDAVARYRAALARPQHPLAEPLERALREHAPSGAWGSHPGALARACADQLERLGHGGVEPTPRGIERLEEVLIQGTPGAIRWLEPLCFQALCDLLAVTAAVHFGREVEWGVCEPDEETKLSPPPLIRVVTKRESFHVPLGEHVLRWCVMPRAQAEEIPSLGAWAEHEFREES
jgi:hypothetical protein